MRREDQDPFRKRLRPFRPVAVVCIGLSARPAGDGVLYIVKYPDVYIISRPKICQNSAQAVFIVIDIRQFQIGRASCRERMLISVLIVAIKYKILSKRILVW